MPEIVPSPEKSAFVEALVRKHQEMLIRFCLKRLSSIADPQDRLQEAQDIVQTVFVNILRCGDITRSEFPIAYLLTATRNALIAAVEARQRGRNLRGYMVPEEESPSEEGEQGDDADCERKLAALDLAIERLPDEHRAFVELNGAGMSATKIGELLDIEPWRARRRLTAALKELRRLVDEILQGWQPK